MGESFIHEVFKALYGDEYEYEGFSYDDALKKIKTLVKQSEHKELDIAFGLVVNKSHWKEGNRVKLSERILNKYKDVIEAAVIFYTGGGCEFYYTGNKKRTYWCEFEGYYANGMEG